MPASSPAFPETPSSTHPPEVLPTQPNAGQPTGFGFGDEFLSPDAFSQLFTNHPADTSPPETSYASPASEAAESPVHERVSESPAEHFADDNHPAWLISALGQSGIRDAIAIRTEAPRSSNAQYDASDLLRRPTPSEDKTKPASNPGQQNDSSAHLPDYTYEKVKDWSSANAMLDYARQPLHRRATDYARAAAEVARARSQQIVNTVETARRSGNPDPSVEPMLQTGRVVEDAMTRAGLYGGNIVHNARIAWRATEADRNHISREVSAAALNAYRRITAVGGNVRNAYRARRDAMQSPEHGNPALANAEARRSMGRAMSHVDRLREAPLGNFVQNTQDARRHIGQTLSDLTDVVNHDLSRIIRPTFTRANLRAVLNTITEDTVMPRPVVWARTQALRALSWSAGWRANQRQEAAYSRLAALNTQRENDAQWQRYAARAAREERLRETMASMRDGANLQTIPIPRIDLANQQSNAADTMPPAPTSAIEKPSLASLVDIKLDDDTTEAQPDTAPAEFDAAKQRSIAVLGQSIQANFGDLPVRYQRTPYPSDDAKALATYALEHQNPGHSFSDARVEEVARVIEQRASARAREALQYLREHSDNSEQSDLLYRLGEIGGIVPPETVLATALVRSGIIGWNEKFFPTAEIAAYAGQYLAEATSRYLQAAQRGQTAPAATSPASEQANDAQFDMSQTSTMPVPTINRSYTTAPGNPNVSAQSNEIPDMPGLSTYLVENDHAGNHTYLFTLRNQADKTDDRTLTVSFSEPDLTLQGAKARLLEQFQPSKVGDEYGWDVLRVDDLGIEPPYQERQLIPAAVAKLRRRGIRVIEANGAANNSFAGAAYAAPSTPLPQIQRISPVSAQSYPGADGSRRTPVYRPATAGGFDENAWLDSDPQPTASIPVTSSGNSTPAPGIPGHAVARAQMSFADALRNGIDSATSKTLRDNQHTYERTVQIANRLFQANPDLFRQAAQLAQERGMRIHDALAYALENGGNDLDDGQLVATVTDLLPGILEASHANSAQRSASRPAGAR